MNHTAAVQQSALFADKKQNKKFLAMGGMLFAIALLATMPEVALAAGVSETTTGTGNEGDFNEVWTTLKEWTQGSLGRVIAGSMILVGIIGGIARQSIMAFAIGIAGGMGLTYAPNIIETVVSATLENAEAATVAAIQVSNGLGL